MPFIQAYYVVAEQPHFMDSCFIESHGISSPSMCITGEMIKKTVFMTFQNEGLAVLVHRQWHPITDQYHYCIQ